MRARPRRPAPIIRPTCQRQRPDRCLEPSGTGRRVRRTNEDICGSRLNPHGSADFQGRDWENPALQPVEPSPAIEYARRRGERDESVRQLVGRESVVGRLRLALFGGVLIVLAIIPASIESYAVWLTPAIAVFVAAVVWNSRVRAALNNARRAARYYARGEARLADRWAGTGLTGSRHADASHPYSADLDLFGNGSLYQYLCDAHTPAGQDALAAWLLAPAAPATVRGRQEAIRELRPAINLRESLWTLGDPTQPELKTRALLQWTGILPTLTDRLYPALSAVVGLLVAAAAIGWGWFGLGPSPFLLAATLAGVLYAILRHRLFAATADLSAVLAELVALLPVLRLVERQRFTSPVLRDVVQRLTVDGDGPSHRIARLAKLLDYWDTVRRNQLVAPIAFLLLLPVHLAYAIDRWRARDGRHVRGWLAAVGDFEALCCLAAAAYEHPDWPFAEIVEGGPLLDAEGLGHPLLPAARRVANDLRLGAEPALLLVSGSNMSGKSTLMRSVGTNVVLAMAGAPVCATRFTLSPLVVGAAMRQSDSLQEGVSAFYAEIQRLKEVRDLTAGPVPVLFLLDEVLRGTNSHDRRVGAEAVVKRLLQGGAIGLVSTHDLALAEMVDRLGPKAANVHFEDQCEDNRLMFDYRLRPGVVPRGNGLVLMRLLGFEV